MLVSFRERWAGPYHTQEARGLRWQHWTLPSLRRVSRIPSAWFILCLFWHFQQRSSKTDLSWALITMLCNMKNLCSLYCYPSSSSKRKIDAERSVANLFMLDFTETTAKGGEVKSLYNCSQPGPYAKSYCSLHICPLKMVLAIMLFMIGLIFPHRRVYRVYLFSIKKNVILFQV